MVDAETELPSLLARDKSCMLLPGRFSEGVVTFRLSEREGTPSRGYWGHSDDFSRGSDPRDPYELREDD